MVDIAVKEIQEVVTAAVILVRMLLSCEANCQSILEVACLTHSHASVFVPYVLTGSLSGPVFKHVRLLGYGD